MAFADTQVRKLRSKLSARHVRSREADGQTLHYLEGWHVVAEANRIFGFDGWDRETVTSDCVWTRQKGQRYCAAYVARVRITVRAGDDRVVREGCGVGESDAASPGQAHDFAAKAAETDATKRALSTFGNAFGLSLYGGTWTAEAVPKKSRGVSQSPSALLPDATVDVVAPSPTTDRPSPEMPSTEPRGAQQHGAQASEATKPETRNSCQVTEPEPSSANSQQAPHTESPALLPDHGNGPACKAVDKSILTLPEPRRVRDRDHLRFVASQPCLICGRTPAEAHHLRFAQPRAMGLKVSDAYTVPLCALHHRELHARGDEAQWWEERQIDPMPAAEALWERSQSPKGSRWVQETVRDPTIHSR